MTPSSDVGTTVLGSNTNDKCKKCFLHSQEKIACF